MEVIKVIFFALGSFFGIENSAIIAEKTNVTIDIEKQIITVNQHNLFTMVRDEKDSLKVSEELYRLGNPAAKDEGYTFREEFAAYTSKTYDITSDDKNKQLHATIELNYTTKEQLKDFAIDYVPDEDSYALINIDSWNIETTTGELRGNYWYFKDEISFSLSPAKGMPEKYKSFQRGLYEYWENVKP